jgi:hypothetical protein
MNLLSNFVVHAGFGALQILAQRSAVAPFVSTLF